MSSTQGTKGIRDPHLIRLEEPDADGNKYVMLGTDLHAEGSASGGSWNQINASTYLVVAKSKDLVIWTDPELVSTGLEGKVGNAWLPKRSGTPKRANIWCIGQAATCQQAETIPLLAIPR